MWYFKTRQDPFDTKGPCLTCKTTRDKIYVIGYRCRIQTPQKKEQGLVSWALPLENRFLFLYKGILFSVRNDSLLKTISAVDLKTEAPGWPGAFVII